MADLDDLFGSIRSSAARAPVPPGADVRRRGAQRTRNGRVLAATAALAVVAGTGTVLLTGTGGNDSLQPPQVAVQPTQTPTPSLDPVPTAPGPGPSAGTSPASAPSKVPTRPAVTPSKAAAATPRLSVDLVRTSPDGVAAVTYAAKIRGLVPQLSGAEDGTPVSGAGQLLGTDVDLGDGRTDGSDGGQVTCRPGAPLVPLAADFDNGTDSAGQVMRYARPGTYTITFTARACGVTAKDSITFTVTEAAPPSAALTVDVQRTSPDGAARVTWTARVRGQVPLVHGGPDGVMSLSTRIDLGDGTVLDPPGTGGCTPDAPLVPESEDIQQPDAADGGPRVYAPGTYTVTVTVTVCGGRASGSTTFTVV